MLTLLGGAITGLINFFTVSKTYTYEIVRLVIIVGLPSLMKIIYSWSKYFIDKLRKKNNLDKK